MRLLSWVLKMYSITSFRIHVYYFEQKFGRYLGKKGIEQIIFEYGKIERQYMNDWSLGNTLLK